jgi:hypothetical protein
VAIHYKTNGSINLQWRSPICPGQTTEFEIELQGADDYRWKSVKLEQTTVDTQADIVLGPGREYKCRIFAKNSIGRSPPLLVPETLKIMGLYLKAEILK